MTAKHHCGICTGPMTDAAVACHRCSTRLEADLADIPAWTRELQVTVTRQARIGGGDGGRPSAESPLPFAWSPADLAWTVTNTLTTWARHITEERGTVLSPTVRTTGDLTVWLIGQVAWLRHRPEVVEVADEIGWLAQAIPRAVDRPAERWFAGECGAITDEQLVDAVFGGPTARRCEAQLYAVIGHTHVTCPVCGTEHTVDDRRKHMLASAEEKWLTAAEIARAVSMLGGTQVSAHRIRKWRHRGRLHPVGVTVKGQPTYRCGDVLDLLAEDAGKKTIEREAG